MGESMYGYMHFYLGMTMMQVMSFMLRSLYKKKNILFPRRLVGPQESYKRFSEEKKFSPPRNRTSVSLSSRLPHHCASRLARFSAGEKA